MLVNKTLHSSCTLIVDSISELESLFAITRRISSSKTTDGASSNTFWFRHWIEHSLSARYTCSSPCFVSTTIRTNTKTLKFVSHRSQMSLSIFECRCVLVLQKTSQRTNDHLQSSRLLLMCTFEKPSKRRRHSCQCDIWTFAMICCLKLWIVCCVEWSVRLNHQATHMPLPPPPNVALIITGYPMSRAVTNRNIAFFVLVLKLWAFWVTNANGVFWSFHDSCVAWDCVHSDLEKYINPKKSKMTTKHEKKKKTVFFVDQCTFFARFLLSILSPIDWIANSPAPINATPEQSQHVFAIFVAKIIFLTRLEGFTPLLWDHERSSSFQRETPIPWMNSLYPLSSWQYRATFQFGDNSLKKEVGPVKVWFVCAGLLILLDRFFFCGSQCCVPHQQNGHASTPHLHLSKQQLFWCPSFSIWITLTAISPRFATRILSNICVSKTMTTHTPHKPQIESWFKWPFCQNKTGSWRCDWHEWRGRCEALTKMGFCCFLTFWTKRKREGARKASVITVIVRTFLHQSKSKQLFVQNGEHDQIQKTNHFWGQQTPKRNGILDRITLVIGPNSKVFLITFLHFWYNQPDKTIKLEAMLVSTQMLFHWHLWHQFNLMAGAAGRTKQTNADVIPPPAISFTQSFGEQSQTQHPHFALKLTWNTTPMFGTTSERTRALPEIKNRHNQMSGHWSSCQGFACCVTLQHDLFFVVLFCFCLLKLQIQDDISDSKHKTEPRLCIKKEIWQEETPSEWSLWCKHTPQ